MDRQAGAGGPSWGTEGATNHANRLPRAHQAGTVRPAGVALALPGARMQLQPSPFCDAANSRVCKNSKTQQNPACSPARGRGCAGRPSPPAQSSAPPPRAAPAAAPAAPTAARCGRPEGPPWRRQRTAGPSAAMREGGQGCGSVGAHPVAPCTSSRPQALPTAPALLAQHGCVHSMVAHSAHSMAWHSASRPGRPSASQTWPTAARSAHCPWPAWRLP